MRLLNKVVYVNPNKKTTEKIGRFARQSRRLHARVDVNGKNGSEIWNVQILSTPSVQQAVRTKGRRSV